MVVIDLLLIPLRPVKSCWVMGDVSVYRRFSLLVRTRLSVFVSCLLSVLSASH